MNVAGIGLLGVCTLMVLPVKGKSARYGYDTGAVREVVLPAIQGT